MILFTEPVIKASPRFSPLDSTERRVARAIREAVDRIQASTSTRAIAAALDAGNIGQAVRLVRFDLGEEFLLSVLPADLREAYEIAGGIASKETGRMLRAGYSFNLITPSAIDWVRQNSGSLIRQWGESSREAIRRLIGAHLEALRGGSVTSAMLARQIKNTGIGLTWRSSRAVLNQRQRWRAQGLEASVVDARAERYFNRLLKDRVEMIARTEMTRAMTQARLESWRQAADKGLLDTGGYEKEWVVTRDARACDDCKDLDGARASIPDGVFIGDAGTNGGTGPGIHPRCRCAVIVVPKGSQKIPRAGVNILGDLGIQKYNPHHVPAGSPEGGQFTSGEGGGGSAAEQYQGLGVASDLNAMLRHGSNPEHMTESEAHQLTQALDQSMKPSDNEMTLYRGGYGPSDKAPLGSVFRDEGFVSTSLSRRQAEIFVQPNSHVLMVIRAPKGTGMMHIPGSGEKEVLLARGTSFRLIDRGSSDGRKFVTVEVVP